MTAMQSATAVRDPKTSGIIDVPNVAVYRQVGPVPPHVFVAERDRALSPATESGLIDLDLSKILGTDYPATTPLLLCRYVVIRRGEEVRHSLRATGEVYFVIRGSGSSIGPDGTRLAWSAGDVFCFPGSGTTRHRATGNGDALLYQATDEPALSYLRLNPPTPDHAPVLAAHFSAREIDKHLASIHEKNERHQGAGKAVIFYTEPMAYMRTMLPAMNIGVNSLEPGGDQRPHRHNSIAVTLAVESEGVHSLVDGQKVPWERFAAFITPPGAVHSHHVATGSPGDMRAFVIQDGGLHYYCRTGMFQYADA
ncbi:MAG: hypothetical protein AB7R90_12800 [Reyranellaceae bacterium]